MSKISKKYFGSDQVDGSILKLEKDQAVRGQKQDGSEVSLFSLDVNDNPIVLGSRVALKSEVDSLDSDFQTHLIEYSGEKAKISQLQSDMDSVELSISNETLRAQGEESAIKGRLDLAEPKISQLQSDMDAAELSISNETLRAQGEESAIKGRLDIAEPKISQLESDMDAAELSISNEVSRAQSAEQALDGRLDVVEPKVTQLESDVVDLESYDLDLRSDVDDLESYSLDLRSDLDQEISDRSEGDIDTLDQAQQYTDAQIAAIPATDLSAYATSASVDSKDAAKLAEAKAYTDAQVQAIVDGPSFGQFNAVVGATTSEFMLDKVVKGIMSCANGRVALHQGYDFTVSVDSVTGFTKLTFIGPSAAGGSSEIESTDQIFVVYAF